MAFLAIPGNTQYEYDNSKYIGKDVDFGDYMGIRCKRYAMLIEDGVFVKEYDDPFIEGVL